MMKPEAIIHVRFLTTDEGGRKSPISGERYGCPVMVGSDGYDCRFVLSDILFELGKEYDIPIKFLNPNIAFQHLQVGTEISLWEGKTIGIGKVVKLISNEED
ncbi:MAG TPA: hypothetical protein ENJ32_05920 [Crenotrichaceae bacterium]|nr:hypothetical protein [Crenotrichaceae bacterium]